MKYDIVNPILKPFKNIWISDTGIRKTKKPEIQISEISFKLSRKFCLNIALLSVEFKIDVEKNLSVYSFMPVISSSESIVSE